MYFPKTQLTTNLYSEGSLLFESTKLPYTGYYFEVSDGRCFTGKEPNDGLNLPLIKPQEEIVDLEYEDTYNPDQQYIPADFRFSDSNFTYSILTKKPKEYTPYSPIPYTPKLTNIDIANGEFRRYFVKKSHEDIYTEINRAGFVLADTSKLYFNFSLNWVIRGIPEEVIRQNAAQVLLKERDFKIKGLGKFLKGNYLRFYQG